MKCGDNTIRVFISIDIEKRAIPRQNTDEKKRGKEVKVL
jgi:hypothetical protein